MATTNNHYLTDLEHLKKINDFLVSVQPESILHIGGERDVWGYDLLAAHSAIPSILLSSYKFKKVNYEPKIRLIQEGINYLDTLLPSSSDIVTMLNIIEYADDTEQIISQSCRIAQRFVVVCTSNLVPESTKETTKKHYFTAESLTRLFEKVGLKQIHFETTNNYLITIARK
jgi:hypothetical protein